MIEHSDYSLDSFRVTKNSVNIPPIFYLKDGKVDAAKLEELLARGASIIITHLEQTVPSFAALCDKIKSRLSENIKAGAIVTTGAGGALPLHYDWDDLIILQVEGTKRWKLYGPAVVNPVRDLPADPPPKSAPILSMREWIRPVSSSFDFFSFRLVVTML